MRRVAQAIGIAPDRIAEYERLHAAAWPSVLAQISRCNIRNYSIYRLGTTLFSYFEYIGADLDADLALMAEDPSTQRWWSICSPMQRPFAERPEGAWWLDLPEVFHTD